MTHSLFFSLNLPLFILGLYFAGPRGGMVQSATLLTEHLHHPPRVFDAAAQTLLDCCCYFARQAPSHFRFGGIARSEGQLKSAHGFPNGCGYYWHYLIRNYGIHPGEYVRALV